MVSGNDAAIALAETVAGSIDDFANLMNQKASSLGLASSHFVTPHGLDQENHYTTAYELAKIADYALNNKIFSSIVKTSNYTITINSKPKNLHNTNELLGNLEGIYGVKTGFTNGANRCLVTACKRNNLDIICVVLGCDTKKDRTLDSIKIINYIYSNFSMVNIYDIIQKEFDNWENLQAHSIHINKAISVHPTFYLDESNIPFKSIAINKDCINQIYTQINFQKNLDSPLMENTIIGNIYVNFGNSNNFFVNILNRNMIKRKSPYYYLSDFLRKFFTYYNI